MGGLSQAATETPAEPHLPPLGAGGFFLGTLFGVGSKDSGPLQSFLAENPRQKPARAESSAPHLAVHRAHGSVYREQTPGVLTVSSWSNWPAALRPLLPGGLDGAPGGPRRPHCTNPNTGPGPQSDSVTSSWVSRAAGKPAVLNHGHAASQTLPSPCRGRPAVFREVPDCRDRGAEASCAERPPGQGWPGPGSQQSRVEKPYLTLTLAMHFAFSRWKEKKMMR